ncbi:hypothetical protein PRJ39_24790 [Lysobacter enzymogenes]|uniref:hypothetical protein n=1 Tax=Lysobacter enzymogenes TaxID=69 RepID=UPI003748B566
MSRISTPAMQRMLPPWLRRLFTPGVPDNHAALSYEAKLMAAYARSALWGLRPPLFQPAPVRFGQAAAPAVHRQLACALGHLNEDLVAGQRFGLTLLIRDLLVRELRAPLVYTLGYVYQNGQRLYHTPIEGLEQMLRTGIAPGARVSLHAWLTLPSHEIVDATFWAAFPALACPQERQQRGLFMHPDQMPGRSYHPQWTSEEFVKRIGVVKEYEGW